MDNKDIEALRASLWAKAFPNFALEYEYESLMKCEKQPFVNLSNALANPDPSLITLLRKLGWERKENIPQIVEDTIKANILSNFKPAPKDADTNDPKEGE